VQTDLTARFDGVAPLTVGLEEEVLLLDSATLEPAARADEVLAALGGDGRFKPELPLSQIEIATPPARTVGEAISVLAAGRGRLLELGLPGLAYAGAGAPPLGRAEGRLRSGERYDALAERYGRIAQRQQVCALQVHVAVGGAARTLAVYNELRGWLPELAALAANAPFHEGRASGLASVRPKISELLPRQGVPPLIDSWERHADDLAWGTRAGALPDGGAWWWELRPHVAFGTLELRVPDAQATVAASAAVAAVAHALVAWLAARADAGDLDPPAASWRIAENRWSACRDGVEGELVGLRSGTRRPARARLNALLDELEPYAARLECAHELAAARGLVEINGAIAQQRLGDARAAAGWLVESFGAAG
jgi:carboxylate-amine ligase